MVIGVIICAIFIHTIFLLSIFDIYFKSPVVNGVNPVQNPLSSLAKRVVLISADGLRLDSLFDRDPESGQYVAPYIRDVIEKRGSWGISESHLPTESRPGHVSIIAGFYEDPSAVTRGWKQNPVNFDSLFNRTRCTYAWGSPDIVPMFAKGTEKNCVYYDSYREEDQRFAGFTTEYDNWVFDKLKNFMETSWLNKSKELENDQVFFFLHLLGQDTSGHTHKPHTHLYRQNLKNVDTLVYKFEKLFNNYYKDNKTAYIFTSDHGMTDWGSHGAGDKSEIETPLVAWGAGIKKPDNSQILHNHTWGLSHLKMRNIQQADITPFIAILLGISIPVNSVGSLPFTYLNASNEFIAQALLLNAHQMSAQFQRKCKIIEEQMYPFLYVPYIYLNSQKIDEIVKNVTKDIDSKNFLSAIEQSEMLIQISLDGLDYFQNYYQKPLFFSLAVSYFLWMFLLILELHHGFSFNPVDKLSFINTLFGALMICTIFLIYSQNLSYLFYCYLLLPQYLSWLVVSNIKGIKYLFNKIKDFKVCILLTTMYMIGIELLVISFFERWVLSINILAIVIWGLFSNYNKSNMSVISIWVISGICLSAFTLLPVIGKKPKIFQVMLSCVLWILYSFIMVYFILKHSMKIERWLSLCSISLICLTTWNILSVYVHFDNYNELSTNHQIISWLLWMVSIFIPLFGTKMIIYRLFSISISLAVPFLLMSVNHEGLFILILNIHLFCWVYFEYLNSRNTYYGISIFEFSFQNKKKHIFKTGTLTYADFRRGFFFITYILISFFGIGNIASLNSFDPVWVRCFLTTFAPFTMTALILFKTVIPFLVVTCMLRGITILHNIHIYGIFIIVLIFSNMMGLNFLFLVKNKGSWLEIGTSISHYVIQQVTVLFLILLYGIAKLLTSYSLNIGCNTTDSLGKLKNVFLPFTQIKKSHPH